MASLDDVSELLRRMRPPEPPYIVGVAGAVAAGKSVFAAGLAAAIASWPDRPVVEVVSTDGFLLDNATLAARGLTLRKGFPESYDAAAMDASLAAIRAGAAEFPGYSHAIYDVDPRLARRIERPDVLIVEGLGLQRAPAETGLDVLVYLDADEALLEAWFTERLIELWRAAENDPTSFYARFRTLNEDQAREFAANAWRRINLPNLRDHIILARDQAHIVVRKGEGHAIEAVRQGRGATSSPGAMVPPRATEA